VEDRVVVELKSVKELQDVFFKQTRTYLRLLDLKVGILVNFNTDDILEDSIHRVVNGL
jgi:GxxExxY protein